MNAQKQPRPMTIFNARTNKLDTITINHDDFSPYIPQDEKTQELYKRHLLAGETPFMASVKTVREVYNLS